jgi:hypothetical protein
MMGVNDFGSTIVVLLLALVIIYVEGEGVSSFLEDSTTYPRLRYATAEARAGGCLHSRRRSLYGLCEG